MPIVEDLIEAIHNGLSTSEDSISIHAVIDIAREKEKTVICPDKRETGFMPERMVRNGRGETMNNADRMTATARRDIGACFLSPTDKRGSGVLRTDVFPWASRPPKGMKTEAVGSRSIETAGSGRGRHHTG